VWFSFDWFLPLSSSFSFSLFRFLSSRISDDKDCRQPFILADVNIDWLTISLRFSSSFRRLIIFFICIFFSRRIRCRNIFFDYFTVFSFSRRITLIFFFRASGNIFFHFIISSLLLSFSSMVSSSHYAISSDYFRSAAFPLLFSLFSHYYFIIFHYFFIFDIIISLFSFISIISFSRLFFAAYFADAWYFRFDAVFDWCSWFFIDWFLAFSLYFAPFSYWCWLQLRFRFYLISEIIDV